MNPVSGTRPSLHPVVAALLTAILPWPSPGLAQDVEFGGQVRPRYEARDPLPDEFESFATIRTRAELTALFEGDVRAFVQFQDVRVFGEERGTLSDFSADNLDLHQGWVEFGHEGLSHLWVRAGRQEVKFGGERLVGIVNWTQQAQAFDGIRAAGVLGRARLDLFAFQLNEEVAPSTTGDDGAFLGGQATLDFEDRSLELYVLHEREEAGLDDTEETTLGGRYVATDGRFTYRLEGSLQRGERTGDDVEAWMLGARVGTRVAQDRVGVTLWYDHLSGDPVADGEVEVFNTVFATNHKFYGLADLFLNIPVNTAGLGLQDYAVKTRFDVRSDVELLLDYHHFRAAEERDFESRRFGDEIDLTAVWGYREGVAFQAGLSWIFEGDLFRELRGLEEDMFWGYAQVNVRF